MNFLSITKSVREMIFKRDGYACRYCKRMPPEIRLCIDHIIPIAKGGDNDDGNLATSCYPCNIKKGRKLLPGYEGKKLIGFHGWIDEVGADYLVRSLNKRGHAVTKATVMGWRRGSCPRWKYGVELLTISGRLKKRLGYQLYILDIYPQKLPTKEEMKLVRTPEKERTEQ